MMLFPHLSFVVEVIGACLLLVMILYAVQLNRRLALLKADKAHLQKLITHFNQSTERAEASVSKLRAGTLEANDSLQASISQAKQLCDDLAFMIDRAGGVADRLEGSIGAGRGERTNRTFGPGANDQGIGVSGVTGLRPANHGRDMSDSGRKKAALLRALDGIR